MITLSPRGLRPRAGLTLVEVLFASAIMSALAGMVYVILYRSTDTYSNESLQIGLDERAREILEEISRDLRESDRETFATGDIAGPVVDGQSYSDLRFGVNPGYDMTERKTVYTRMVRYRFVLAPAESANGVDDDGNGLADEGYLEKTDRYGPITRICSELKRPGLIFVPNARLVKVTVILERRDSRGTLIHREAATSVELRNGS